MKNNKTHIFVLIIIVIGVLAVVGISYSYLHLQNNEQQLRKLQEQVLLLSQPKTSSTANVKPSESKITITSIPKKAAPLLKVGSDLPLLIQKWRSRVALIKCKYVFQDNNMGEQSGSGFLYGTDQDGNLVLFTNDHVIEVAIHNLYGNPMNITLPATSCDVIVPDDSQFATVYSSSSPPSFISWNSSSNIKGKQDFVLITIDKPTPHMRNVLQGNLPLCNKKAALGENIAILGYPGIGSASDITVTEGIVSGYDGDFYITSAKVEHGNSGGVAISAIRNCYLGIPTFVEKGSLESLARILDINAVW